MGECTINCGHPLRNALGISVSWHFPPVSEVNMLPELLGRKTQ